jgi:hypothetical protein
VRKVSNKDKGSVFHLKLPRSETISSSKPEGSSIDNAPKGTLLLIDDEQICHTVMSMILKSEGYTLMSAYGGMEGLNYLRKHKNDIDIILLDLIDLFRNSAAAGNLYVGSVLGSSCT